MENDRHRHTLQVRVGFRTLILEKKKIGTRRRRKPVSSIPGYTVGRMFLGFHIPSVFSRHYLLSAEITSVRHHSRINQLWLWNSGQVLYQLNCVLRPQDTFKLETPLLHFILVCAPRRTGGGRGQLIRGSSFSPITRVPGINTGC